MIQTSVSFFSSTFLFVCCSVWCPFFKLSLNDLGDMGLDAYRIEYSGIAWFHNLYAVALEHEGIYNTSSKIKSVSTGKVFSIKCTKLVTSIKTDNTMLAMVWDEHEEVV